MSVNLTRWIVALVCLLFLALIGGLAAVFVLQPGPEGRIVLATGGSDGAYHELADTYRGELARTGVSLTLRKEVQGADVLRALLDDKSGIHGGIIKGGYTGSLTGRLASVKARDKHDTEAAKVRSVARLFNEPIWVFTRGDLPIESLRDLQGKRILAGVRESGARRVALQLLRANGVNRDNAVLTEGELTDDGAALLKGEADAAVLILPPESDRIQKLLRVANIRLMNFAPEADAYTSRFPALSKVVMSRGSVEFEPVIPSADITLLTTSAVLIVRSDLHPALVSLLAAAVHAKPKSPTDRSGDPVLFHKAGQYPSADDPEYEVAKDARAVIKSGELPLLLRALAPLNARLGLPFSFTAFANAYGVQAALLLIPALTILLPLIKLVPMLYSWIIRQRLLYWYWQLKGVERSLEWARTREEIAAHLMEIERIEAAVRRIKVPLYYSDRHYDLRGHIDLVRQRLLQRQGPMRMAAE